MKLKGANVKKISGAAAAGASVRVNELQREREDRHPTLTVSIFVDASDPRAKDDVYKLLKADGSVHQQFTVESARREERSLSLRFTDLAWGECYSLLVDEGREGKYYAFQEEPLERLLSTFAEDEPGNNDLPGDVEAVEAETLAPAPPDDAARPPSGPNPPCEHLESTADVESAPIR